MIWGFASSVRLPTGLPVGGEILTSHVRSFDNLARPIRHAGGAALAGVLAEVRAKLGVLCGILG